MVSLSDNRPGKIKWKNSEQETGIIYKLQFSYSDFVLKLDLADYDLDPFTLAPNLYLNCNVNCAISLTGD